jgi:HrpA-like RNA helicase
LIVIITHCICCLFTVEYETDTTRAWFVTTGYLVRLLANSPDRFKFFSYIIIDEVHERSVDTDILCLLCRRLLDTNPHIRLVLMSATLAAALYQEYFNVPRPPIKVGARRFPVTEVFLDDLPIKVQLTPKMKAAVLALLKESLAMKCIRTPSMNYMEKLYSVVAFLATSIGRPGSSVLVFVPGMNDIVAIAECVEQLYIPGITFKCLPVHSDVPFDDQMQVFHHAKADEIKIVIATNSAESSVTLPDCDIVICLGLCKQIIYNETSHRQMLMPAWISKASATQRAGRTGRVRPGTVYRMYSRDTFNRMDAFEPGEMIRIPLDSVILMLKEMLSEEVTDVLLSCLEPPNVTTVDRSFQSLHRAHFITTPDDSGEITTLGSFVSALGIDLALGSLIGLGIQFGVGAEAIQLAAILSFPKTPWYISNPLIHEPADYNGMFLLFF